MKKYIPAVCLAVFTVFILMMMPQVAETKYSITTPYEYPEIDDSIWQAEIGANKIIKRAELYAIPDEIIENMSTEALIYTIGNYPDFVVFVGTYDYLMTGMSILYNAPLGFPQLIRRDDLTQAMYNVITELDDDESEGFARWLIELTMGQYTLEYGENADRYHSKVVVEIEDFYEIHKQYSPYEFIIAQHSVRQRLKHRDDTIFDWE